MITTAGINNEFDTTNRTWFGFSSANTTEISVELTSVK